MPNKDYNSLINTKESEFQSLISSLEEIKKSFINQTGLFAKDWFEKTINMKIKDNYENTLKLGTAKLNLLKKELEKLKGQSLDITNEKLSHKELWWHQIYEEDTSTHPFGSDFKEKIEEKIRFILGRLSPLLKKFGYLESDEGILRDWVKSESRGTYGEQEPYYPFHLELPFSLNSIWDKYSELFSIAFNLYSEIRNLKREQKESEAEELWDSA